MKDSKKIDVSKVAGGTLSIQEQGDGKFEIISTKNLGTFDSRESAEEAIYNMAEKGFNHQGCHHGPGDYGEHGPLRGKFGGLIAPPPSSIIKK